MTKLVLFHRDMDGYAAASVAYEKFGKDAKYISVQYGESLPSELDSITKDDEVYILDFSYKKEICDEIYLRSKKLVILDHHDTAEQELKGLDYAIFDMEHSGNVLAFNYFFPKRNLSLFHELVEDRDLWLFRHGDRTRALNLGIETCSISKKDTIEYLAFLSELNDRNVLQQYINNGFILLNKQKTEIAKVKNNDSAYKIVQFNNFPFVFYNALSNISESAEAFYEDEKLDVPCTMSFMVLNDKVVFSLRSNKTSNISVGTIAKSMGGGGHPNAAGFSLPLTNGLQLIDSLFKQ